MRRAVLHKRTFSPVAAAIRESLFRHRLLSTRQIHRLHTPTASIRWTQKVLRRLADAGQVDYVVARRREAQNLWFLTELGGELVELVRGERLGRRAQVTAQGADGDLQAHTLETNDVGIAFVQAARDHGDDCGPLAWQHEVTLPIGHRPAGAGYDVMRADAVLHYVHHDDHDGADLRTWFIELDRATEEVQEVVEKLHRYARFSNYRPDGQAVLAWRALYPLGLPEILIVFSGAASRTALERRMDLVCSSAHAHTELAPLNIVCTLLADLVARGPFAPIWWRPGATDASGLFGHPRHDEAAILERAA